MEKTQHKKSTDDLLEIIKNNNLSKAIDEIKDEQTGVTLAENMTELIAKRRLNTADIWKKAGLNKSYFHALLNGSKNNPSRDILIRICFGFEMNLDEAQNFLKTHGAAPLYARNRRDSIIIHALDNKLTVMQCTGNLDEYGQQPLKG